MNRLLAAAARVEAARCVLILAALPLLFGCDDAVAPPTHVTCDPFLLTFGTAAGDTVQAAEGVRYIDIAVGTGDPATAGGTVDVNYSGHLTNGIQFDTSCPATRATYRLTLGSGGTIPGFEIGLTGMRPGGVRRVIVPPEQGYGSQPYQAIPANSTLIFDLHLVGHVRR